MWNSWSGRVRKWKISPIILKAGWDDKQIKSAVKLTGNHISPRGFPGGSDSKVSACNMGDSGLTPGWGRSPGEGNVNPLQYSCLEFQEQRSLAGYSPWSHKESDMSEQLTLPFIFQYFQITLLLAAAAKSLQSCPTLCDPIEGSPPGSPVPGILQARTLEWK